MITALSWLLLLANSLPVSPIYGGEPDLEYDSAVDLQAHKTACTAVILSPMVGGLTAARCLAELRFGGIATGSLMDLLGLQNGDMPLAVNGHDITTIDGVFVARVAVDNATALTVVVSRSGSPVTLDYLIR